MRPSRRSSSFSRSSGDDVQRIAYDAETRRYNESHGHNEEYFWNGLWDAWGYCYIAAVHARLNPSLSTRLSSDAYDRLSTAVQHAFEQARELSGLPHHAVEDTTAQDVFNREVGITIGSANRSRMLTQSLYQESFNALLDGRLDLTAAGVYPRGRAPELVQHRAFRQRPHSQHVPV